MADRLDSDRLECYCEGQTDRQTFAIAESLSRLIKWPYHWTQWIHFYSWQINYNWELRRQIDCIDKNTFHNSAWLSEIWVSWAEWWKMFFFSKYCITVKSSSQLKRGQNEVVLKALSNGKVTYQFTWKIKYKAMEEDIYYKTIAQW